MVIDSIALLNVYKDLLFFMKNSQIETSPAFLLLEAKLEFGEASDDELLDIFFERSNRVNGSKSYSLWINELIEKSYCNKTDNFGTLYPLSTKGYNSARSRISGRTVSYDKSASRLSAEDKALLDKFILEIIQKFIDYKGLDIKLLSKRYKILTEIFFYRILNLLNLDIKKLDRIFVMKYIHYVAPVEKEDLAKLICVDKKHEQINWLWSSMIRMKEIEQSANSKKYVLTELGCQKFLKEEKNIEEKIQYLVGDYKLYPPVNKDFENNSDNKRVIAYNLLETTKELLIFIQKNNLFEDK